MALIMKQLEPDSYQDFIGLNDENKRYVGSVVLSGQVGGAERMDELKRGNTEIKRIARDFVLDIKKLMEKLSVSEQEKEKLAEDVEMLKETVIELNQLCDEQLAEREKNCAEQISTAHRYVIQFLDIQRQLEKLLSKIKEMVESNDPNLRALSRSTSSYNQLYSKLQEIGKNLNKNPSSCEEAQDMIQLLEKDATPKMFQRILDDFENISGTVRVYVRILNRSLADPSMSLAIGESLRFNYQIDPNFETNKIRKVQTGATWGFTCQENKPELCVLPDSVERDGKRIKRSRFPCNDDREAVPLKHNTAPSSAFLKTKVTTISISAPTITRVSKSL